MRGKKNKGKGPGKGWRKGLTGYKRGGKRRGKKRRGGWPKGKKRGPRTGVRAYARSIVPQNIDPMETMAHVFAVGHSTTWMQMTDSNGKWLLEIRLPHTKYSIELTNEQYGLLMAGNALTDMRVTIAAIAPVKTNKKTKKEEE